MPASHEMANFHNNFLVKSNMNEDCQALSLSTLSLSLRERVSLNYTTNHHRKLLKHFEVTCQLKPYSFPLRKNKVN